MPYYPSGKQASITHPATVIIQAFNLFKNVIRCLFYFFNKFHFS